MNKIDDYHRHEALDRASMLAQNLSVWLLQHPYIDSQPHIRAKVVEAVNLLHDVYQEIAVEHLK
jgi:hypothetical protein